MPLHGKNFVVGCCAGPWARLASRQSATELLGYKTRPSKLPLNPELGGRVPCSAQPRQVAADNAELVRCWDAMFVTDFCGLALTLPFEEAHSGVEDLVSDFSSRPAV